ncbi:DUF1269 domain-containing protein [Streptosporangium canum]|uniref:DUF1269 domain-containing protein n=1 Tax=Streptosporangium canum TaxID=324952 RepID=UPI003447B35F
MAGGPPPRGGPRIGQRGERVRTPSGSTPSRPLPAGPAQRFPRAHRRGGSTRSGSSCAGLPLFGDGRTVRSTRLSGDKQRSAIRRRRTGSPAPPPGPSGPRTARRVRFGTRIRGVDLGFVKELGEHLPAGGAALFLLLTTDIDRVIAAIAPYGGHVIRTTLSAPEEQRVQRAIATAQAPGGGAA